MEKVSITQSDEDYLFDDFTIGEDGFLNPFSFWSEMDQSGNKRVKIEDAFKQVDCFRAGPTLAALNLLDDNIDALDSVSSSVDDLDGINGNLKSTVGAPSIHGQCDRVNSQRSSIHYPLNGQPNISSDDDMDYLSLLTTAPLSQNDLTTISSHPLIKSDKCAPQNLRPDSVMFTTSPTPVIPTPQPCLTNPTSLNHPPNKLVRIKQEIFEGENPKPVILYVKQEPQEKSTVEILSVPLKIDIPVKMECEQEPVAEEITPPEASTSKDIDEQPIKRSDSLDLGNKSPMKTRSQLIRHKAQIDEKALSNRRHTIDISEKLSPSSDVRPQTRNRSSSMSTDCSFSSHDEGFASQPDEDTENEDEDDDEEMSSDDESFYGEYPPSSLIGATTSDDVNNKWSLNIGRSRKSSQQRYFWQYNVQSKGPKGTRIVSLKEKIIDPHVLCEARDPVFSPDCHVEGVKHAGKARRGDGNDLTPNPKKLLMIGLELKKLSKVISELAPVAEVPSISRCKSRKEKNKLASRVCRLKKKAQHEANKIKLHGLHQEHKKLLCALIEIKRMARTHAETHPGDVKLLDCYEKIFVGKGPSMRVAGNTTDFVNSVLDNVASGQSDCGIKMI